MRNQPHSSLHRVQESSLFHRSIQWYYFSENACWLKVFIVFLPVCVEKSCPGEKCVKCFEGQHLLTWGHSLCQTSCSLLFAAASMLQVCSIMRLKPWLTKFVHTGFLSVFAVLSTPQGTVICPHEMSHMVQNSKRHDFVGVYSFFTHVTSKSDQRRDKKTTDSSIDPSIAMCECFKRCYWRCWKVHHFL